MGCIACLEKDDRYQHTCNKGANSMNALEQEIIIKLVDNNEGRPDDLKGCGIFCHNVPCYLCPVNINKKITLGEIRAMDIRKPKLEKPEVTTTDDQPYAKDIDDVRKPSHYQVFDGVESIEIIARSLTVSEFRGFCMGNVLKYRLRAGKKSEMATMEKDLNKAAFYQELFDLHKGKCYAAE